LKKIIFDLIIFASIYLMPLYEQGLAILILMGIDFITGIIASKKNDMFITPKPYDSWLLDLEIGDWYSPIPYPNDDKMYYWNESILNWELVDYES
jgi:hypothetical protein